MNFCRKLFLLKFGGHSAEAFAILLGPAVDRLICGELVSPARKLIRHRKRDFSSANMLHDLDNMMVRQAVFGASVVNYNRRV